MPQKIKTEILISTKQILELCSFAGIAVDKKKSSFSDDEELLETEYRIVQNDHGIVIWLDEYPEEGCCPLSDNYPAEESDPVDR